MKYYYMILLTVFLAGYWINLNGQSTPRQGEIVVTEIMVNPESVSDANGEWFEIWNSADYDLLLNGITIKDAGSNLHVMTSTEKLILPAKSYWVLAKNGDTQTNGGLTANYVYQNFTLSNTADQVIINASDGNLLDQVSYGSGWPVISGASMELPPNYLSFAGNDQPEHWFPAKIPFGAGDKGSPGRVNPVSSGMEEWDQEIKLDIFPNPTKGKFILAAIFARAQSGEIRFVNLLGQDFLYKSFRDQKTINEKIESSFLTPGIWFVEIISGNKTKISRLIIDN